MKRGIMSIGTTVLDVIKEIDRLPEKNHVSIVHDIKEDVGGNVPNVLIDLAVLVEDFPLFAVGLVGNDSQGKYIIEQLSKNNINTDYMKIENDIATSQSDIMTLSDTGERTVFYYKGASACISLDYIQSIKTDCKIVQIAYLGTLDKLEQKNQQYDIVKALDHFLQQGCYTSIDIVSVDFNDKLKDTLRACLPYTSYFVANEIESSLLHDIEIRKPDNTIVRQNIKKSLEKYIEQGVRECAVIHCPEMAAYLDCNGNYFEVDSYHLPSDQIQGAVGAGDAFTAAFLYAMHENIDIETALRYGHVSARYNLQHKSSVGGAVSIKTIQEFLNKN